jgi:hypothetical protein
MSSRLITGAVLALMLAGSPALACKGPNLIFSDDFRDVDPAWAPGYGTFAIASGRATLKTDPGYIGNVFYQGAFFDSGDACLDVITPEAKNTSNMIAGFLFGGIGNNDFYAFIINPDGNAGVIRMQNGGWLHPVPTRKADGIKPGANAVNTLRVTWSGTTGAAYINDKLFSNFKTQGFKNTTIGVYGETDGATWAYDNLKITDTH